MAQWMLRTTHPDRASQASSLAIATLPPNRSKIIPTSGKADSSKNVSEYDPKKL
jgi:hypothetical protein